MAELHWDPHADAAMTQLETDLRLQHLLASVNQALDRLENDPGDAQVRRRRYSSGVWGVPVSGDGEDWLLVWEPQSASKSDVIVQYLGPDI